MNHLRAPAPGWSTSRLRPQPDTESHPDSLVREPTDRTTTLIPATRDPGALQPAAEPLQGAAMNAGATI